MPRKKKKNTVEKFEKALAASDAQIYILRLCISGMTPRSRKALLNLKKLCDEYFEGHYELEIIDLYQQPELAARYQVITTPTLLRNLPPRLRRMFGDLSNTKTVMHRLGIAVKEG